MVRTQIYLTEEEQAELRSLPRPAQADASTGAQGFRAIASSDSSK